VLQEAKREPVVLQEEAEAVRQDVTQQPAGANKEGGSSMDVRGGCAMRRCKAEAAQQEATL